MEPVRNISLMTSKGQFRSLTWDHLRSRPRVGSGRLCGMTNVNRCALTRQTHWYHSHVCIFIHSKVTDKKKTEIRRNVPPWKVIQGHQSCFCVWDPNCIQISTQSVQSLPSTSCSRPNIYDTPQSARATYCYHSHATALVSLTLGKYRTTHQRKRRPLADRTHGSKIKASKEHQG